MKAIVLFLGTFNKTNQEIMRSISEHPVEELLTLIIVNRKWFGRSGKFKEFAIKSKTDVEKYMKVHKFFVLGFLIFNCDRFLRFLLDNHLIIEKNNVFTHHEGA